MRDRLRVTCAVALAASLIFIFVPAALPQTSACKPIEGFCSELWVAAQDVGIVTLFSPAAVEGSGLTT